MRKTEDFFFFLQLFVRATFAAFGADDPVPLPYVAWPTNAAGFQGNRDAERVLGCVGQEGDAGWRTNTKTSHVVATGLNTPLAARQTTVAVSGLRLGAFLGGKLAP